MAYLFEPTKEREQKAYLQLRRQHPEVDNETLRVLADDEADSIELDSEFRNLWD